MEMDQIHPPRPNCTQRLAASTVPVAATALAANVVGSGWVRIGAETTDIQYIIGPSTMTTIAAGATGSGSTVGPTIAAGSFEDVYLTGTDTHITYVGAASGAVTIRKAGQKKTSPG